MTNKKTITKDKEEEGVAGAPEDGVADAPSPKKEQIDECSYPKEITKQKILDILNDYQNFIDIKTIKKRNDIPCYIRDVKDFMERLKEELYRRDVLEIKLEIERQQNEESYKADKAREDIMSYLRENLFLMNNLCGKIHCNSNELSLVIDSIVRGRPGVTYKELMYFVDSNIVENGLDMDGYNKKDNIDKDFADYYDFMEQLSASSCNWVDAA